MSSHPQGMVKDELRENSLASSKDPCLASSSALRYSEHPGKYVLLGKCTSQGKLLPM